MSAYVAEYFGQRTDAPSQILPIEIPFNTAGKVAWASKTDIPKCPFSGGNSCKKLKSGYEPVCAVRNADGVLWCRALHPFSFPDPARAWRVTLFKSTLSSEGASYEALYTKEALLPK